MLDLSFGYGLFILMDYSVLFLHVFSTQLLVNGYWIKRKKTLNIILLWQNHFMYSNIIIIYKE